MTIQEFLERRKRAKADTTANILATDTEIISADTEEGEGIYFPSLADEILVDEFYGLF